MVADRSDKKFGLFRVGVYNQPRTSGDDKTTRRTVVILACAVEAENKGFVHVSKAASCDGIPDPVGLLIGNHGKVIGDPFSRFSSG